MPAARGAGAAPRVSFGVPFGWHCLAQICRPGHGELPSGFWSDRAHGTLSRLWVSGAPSREGRGNFIHWEAPSAFPPHELDPGWGGGLRRGGDERWVAWACEGMGFEKMPVSYM